MRVTLSPTVQIFGQDAAAGASPSHAVVQTSVLPSVTEDEALPVIMDGLEPLAQGWSGTDNIPASGDADIQLDPALEAWLAPVTAGDPATGNNAEAMDFFCATLRPAVDQQVFATPAFDRDKLERDAREALSTVPISQGSRLRMTIDVASADICGIGRDGALQVRFDPRFGSCDPVFVALDPGAAVVLARRILGCVEPGTTSGVLE